jgi:membrane protein implicated in regulation of membrane protease activity
LCAAWGIGVFWVIKDIVLYPVVGRYYNPDYGTDRFSMIGLIGIAQEPLTPEGYIRVKGELWKAKILGEETAVNAGDPVIVRGIDGLRLTVQPQKPVSAPADGIPPH